MSPRIGIDLGGTKTSAISLDRSGRERARRRVETPRGDYPATIRMLIDLVLGIEQETGAPGSVGIGMPGSISPGSGLVQNANSVWLNGRPFKQDIEAALEREVRLANDANCFALSEAVDGAGAGAGIVFGVILGTGCGGGIVLGGRVLEGRRGIAGEWGHNPLPHAEPDETPGPRCWCGRSGCLEAWVSGPAVASDHRARAGRPLTPKEIVAAAVAGDAAARQTLERHGSRLARGLAAVVNLIDPDVIVLGGGLSNFLYLYDVLPPLVAPHVFAEHAKVTIRPPLHGDDSGVRGAARLWEICEFSW